MQKRLHWILRKWSPTICVYPNPFKISEFWEISRRLGRNSKGSLLDLGCGGGLQTVLLSRKFGTVLGVDIDDGQFADAQQRLHRWNRDRIRFLQGDLLEMQLLSASMDVVVSFSVLEHIANWERVLEEIFRLLKPGGRLVLSVDSLATLNDRALIEAHRRTYAVSHYFSEAELQGALRAVGFRRITTRPIFTSAFARQLFAEGIRRDFKFTRLGSILDSFRLRFHEDRTPGALGGIFLVADAAK